MDVEFETGFELDLAAVRTCQSGNAAHAKPGLDVILAK
jgi:hypothetical protein